MVVIGDVMGRSRNDLRCAQKRLENGSKTAQTKPAADIARPGDGLREIVCVT